MKRLLIALLLLGCFASCKKDKNYCWHCSFGFVSGVQPPERDVCNDTPEAPGPFTDAQGNPEQSFCQPK